MIETTHEKDEREYQAELMNARCKGVFELMQGRDEHKVKEDFLKTFQTLRQKEVQESMAQETKMLRYDSGKPNWTLIDFKTIEPMVRVMEYGATKYQEGNWKLPPNDPKQPLQSAFRHLIALVSGEEIDEESGVSHAGHVMTNMMIYMYHNNKKHVE